MGKIHSLFSQKTQSPIFGRILNMPLRLVLSHHNFKNELLTLNKSSYWIWSFYHSWNTVYRFGPFLGQFWICDVTSPELPIVAWSRYIALKLLWRIWETEVKEGLPFHIFLKIFYKNIKMLVLRNNLSHFSRRLKKNLPRYKKIFDIWHKIFAQFK